MANTHTHKHHLSLFLIRIRLLFSFHHIATCCENNQNFLLKLQLKKSIFHSAILIIDICKAL